MNISKTGAACIAVTHILFFFLGYYCKTESSTKQIVYKEVYKAIDNNKCPDVHAENKSVDVEKEQEVASVKLESGKAAVAITPEAENNDQESKVVDKNFSTEVESKLYYGSENEKVEAVVFLSKNGTAEIKNSIKELSFSQEDSSVRSVAIMTSDWTDDYERLIRLLDNDNDPSIRQAVITAFDLSENIQNDTYSKDSFSKVVMDSLRQENDAKTIVDILEYLRKQGEEHLSEACSILRERELPKAVINFLKEQRLKHIEKCIYADQG